MSTNSIVTLPADFVFAMRDTAYTTLHEWLQGAGAPTEVLGLLRAYSSLAVPEFADADTVAQAARDIAALGGAFNGPATMGISHVKEHAKAWAAARYGAQQGDDFQPAPGDVAL